MKITQNEEFRLVEYTVFAEIGYKMMKLDGNDNFYNEHHANKYSLYYLVKDGTVCCNNLFYCMINSMVGNTAKEVLESNLNNNRYVCLYTPVSVVLDKKNVKPAKCVFDTSLNKIVYFEDFETYKEFEVYGNIMVSRLNKCVAYLPSMEVVLQFKDNIEVVANSENHVVVCNDKYNSTKIYRI